MQWDKQVEYAGLTDTGVRRSVNQDSYALVPAGGEQAWRARGHLFMVADGMGAHAAGELASKIAVDSVPLTYQKLSGSTPEEALRKALKEANATIHERGKQNRDFRGMGTTATVLALLPEKALIGHVGDTRVYRVRSGVIQQLTFDHSLSWELMDQGRMERKEAETFVPQNVITRSLGPDPAVEIDIEGPHPIHWGDVFVLCSDGLSGPVRDEEIGIIAGHLPPDEACQVLVDLANLRGGPDNISVVIVRPSFSEAADPPRSTSDGKRKKPLVRPVFWQTLLSTLFLVAGALLWSAGRDRFALQVFLIGAAVVALAGALSVWRQRRWEERFGAERPHKHAYPSSSCELNRTQVGQLAALVSHLHQVATEEGWQVEWKSYREHVQAAESCASCEDWEEALRDYCRAIHVLAGCLRQQRGTAQSKLAET